LPFYILTIYSGDFLFFLLIIWIASTAIFLIPRLSGQDPVKEKLLLEAQRGGHMQMGLEDMAANYSRKFGLDKPLIVQYGNYMKDLLRFDFGPSIAYFPKSVNSLIGDSLIWTFGLLSVCTFIAFFAGTIAGALLGWPRSPNFLQYVFMPILTLAAIPYYLLALVLIYIFAFNLDWFPLFGGYAVAQMPEWSFDFAGQVIHHAILPSASIVLASLGFWALGMRGMMVTNQGEDYMIAAEAKGLRSIRLFFNYAVRNAVLPQTTALALSLGTVFTGSVLVEVIFRYPGLGNTLYQAIKLNDFFVIRGMIFIVILTLGLATFIIDVTYPLLDPRVSYKKGG
jgi:peptide/nickel transport system permease protein